MQKATLVAINQELINCALQLDLNAGFKFVISGLDVYSGIGKLCILRKLSLSQ